MAEFINTRDSMGEAAALDALVAGTLTELNENGTTSIGTRALYGNRGLQRVNFPALTTMNTYAMANCANLETVDIGAKCTISANAFNGDSKLKDIILRGDTMSTLSNVNALTGTPIPIGMGGIYVPSALLATYKSGSNWSTYASNIFPIDDYPKSDYSTITDTWEQILAAEENGTYSTKYHIGDTKAISVGEQLVYMQIAAIDGDELADNSGNAKITWLAKNFYTTHNMNSSSTTTGGWPATAMRSYLESDVLTALPQAVQAAIKAVKKTYYDYASTSTLTSNDRIWIPSTREICFTGSNLKENSGVQYSGLFTNDNSRIKYNMTSGSAYGWWLRSANGSSGFYYVYSNGSYGNSGANFAGGVVFGFCT